MSARTLMVNEGFLQEMEKRIAELRKVGTELVKGMVNPKAVFAEGMALVAEYSVSVEVLQELGKQLFSAYDLCDPEDNELLRREEEDDEEEDEDEDDSDDADDEAN